MLDDAVATQDTVTQLIATVRKVRSKVRSKVRGAVEVVARVTGAHDDDPGEPKIAWNDEQAREQLIDALVRDALAVVQASGKLPPGPAVEPVGLLGAGRRPGRRTRRPRPRPRS